MKRPPTKQQVQRILTERAARGDQGARFVLFAQRGAAERHRLAMDPAQWPALFEGAAQRINRPES